MERGAWSLGHEEEMALENEKCKLQGEGDISAIRREGKKIRLSGAVCL
jgi:hypothetical protein